MDKHWYIKNVSTLSFVYQDLGWYTKLFTDPIFLLYVDHFSIITVDHFWVDIYNADSIKFYLYEHLKQTIEHYIKYYNEERIKEKLGYLSPVEYRKKNAAWKFLPLGVG